MSDIPTIQSGPIVMDETFVMKIPECCREGWADCPHVANRKPKPKRSNIGL